MRIPQKNIVEFCGKPLIGWTIEAAQQSGIFSRILVSTDDPEIAAIAEKWGVAVPFLRNRYHDDNASVSMATIYALDQVQKQFSEEFENVIQLMPNCPLRESSHIQESHEHFISHNDAFQLSCFKFGWTNPWWAMTLDNKGRPSPLHPGALNQRSQDLEKLYCPSGAIWIANIAALRQSGTFYGPAHRFHPLDWKAAIDIDDREDMEMAEALYHMR